MVRIHDYHDTRAFTRAHRVAIATMAEEMASELGESGAVALVRGFRCLDKETPERAIYAGLYGGRVPAEMEDDLCQVENALAWFALEEVGRALAND